MFSNIFSSVPIIVYVGIVIVIGFGWYVHKEDNGTKEDGDKSHAFSKPRDFKDIANNKDGFQLSKQIFLNAKTCNEHILIVGPTGAGKTTALFYPNLLQKDSFCCGESTIIVTDPKGELYRDTSAFQRSLGREPLIFCPYEPQSSMKYNPLEFCKTPSEVISLARSVLASGGKAMEFETGSSGGSDAKWLNMTVGITASAMLYCWLQGAPYNTVRNALDTILNTPFKDLTLLLGNHEDENVRTQYNTFVVSGGSEATMASIYTTLTTNLQTFTDPVISKITEYSSFEFEDFRKKPIVLYIVYPVEKSADLAPLMSIFFGQMITKCKEYDDYAKMINERNKKERIKGKDIKSLQIFCAFDEFANVGAIPKLSTHITTLRSYRISFICCVQDINQINTVYGFNGKTIVSNLKSTVVFGGLKEMDTLRQLNTLCGKTTVEIINKSEKPDGGTSKNITKKEVDVMSISELRELPSDKILLMLISYKPFIDKQNIFYKHSKYTNKITPREKVIC